MRPPPRPGSARSSSRSGRAPRRDRGRSRRGGRTRAGRACPRGLSAMNASSSLAGVGRHRPVVARVDPLDHPHVVGHELVEQHVDAPVGGQEVAVAHARAQQPVDAVDPVLGERLGFDRGAAHAVAVREHRDRRLDHRHRIAVRDRERRVGERREQRRDLLEVLRRLQHPAVRAAEEREHLQHLLHVRVVRALVEREVEVAPARHPGQPLERVRREVEVLELDLLLDRGRVLVVHRAAAAAPSASAPRSRAGSARSAGRRRRGPGPSPGTRARFEALPVRERPQPGVGRDEVHEVRRARAGQADHDDRRRQLDGEDLGPAAHEVLDEEARGEQAQRALVDREPAERSEPGVGFDRGDHRVEPRAEAGIAEVVAAGAVARRARASRRRRSGCRASRRSRAPRAARRRGCGSRRSSMRIASVTTASSRSSRFVALRTSPSSQRVSQKFAPSVLGEQLLVRARGTRRARRGARRRPRARARTGAPRSSGSVGDERRGARPRPRRRRPRARRSRPRPARAARRRDRASSAGGTSPRTSPRSRGRSSRPGRTPRRDRGRSGSRISRIAVHTSSPSFIAATVASCTYCTASRMRSHSCADRAPRRAPGRDGRAAAPRARGR